jgi:hypothetical protein
MRKRVLPVALVLLVCICGALPKFCAALDVAPFCKMTFVDHRGHSIKLHTKVMHASHTSLTFIFETGEKLIIKFTTIRAGHFVAESARSKDPQITFYPSHSSQFYPMVGAVIISTTKPKITGHFFHLVSDDDDVHLTLVSGSFHF